MSENRPTLSLSMIVRNEAIHITRLLKVVATFADQIVVLDTGSTDETKTIAAAHGAEVYDFVWCDDFSKARNESLKHCNMDFVMWLDADDLIESLSALRLRELFLAPVNWDVLYLPYYYNYSPEGGRKGKLKMPPRIWRNHMGIHWIYPIHEYLVYPQGVRKNRAITNIEVLHHPLGDDAVKSNRNLRIMKKILLDPAQRNNHYILWHIAKEHSQLSNPHQAAYYFEKAIKYCPVNDRFLLARLHLGLARQYRRLGDHTAALIAGADCAVAYGDWREPYCEMAENLFWLGDARCAESYLALAEGIKPHNHQVERAELYDSEFLSKFKARLRGYAVVGAEVTTRISGKSFRIAAGGDVCLGRQLPGLVEKHGALWCFRGVSDRMRAADLTLVNLETVTSTLGDFAIKGGLRPFYYRNRPELLEVLIRAGVNVVNVANNHSGDFGPDALEQQLEILDACMIAQCGGGHDYVEAAIPAYITVGDRLVALIGIETETPALAAGANRTGIYFAPEDKITRNLAASIAKARCNADVVIVTPHWGRNWDDNPTEARRHLARQIIDLGADAVLGHSAHVLQGIEVYRGRPIVYDMGTLLFDRVAESRMRFSALFELDVGKLGIERLRIVPIQLLRGRARLADEVTSGYVRGLIVRLSEVLDPAITFNQVGDVLEIELLPDRSHVPLPRIPLRGCRAYLPSAVRSVPRYYCQLVSNVVYPETPIGAAFTCPVTVNPRLQVCGARHARTVRPGYGFLCEVFFRAEAPASGRWEARITGVTADGSKAFEYTHPVAEGVWPQSRWRATEVIGDRVVVRPSVILGEGIYRLLWSLVDRDGVETLEISLGGDVLEGGGVPIGVLVVSASAPSGVAWIEPEKVREVDICMKDSFSATNTPHIISTGGEVAKMDDFLYD